MCASVSVCKCFVCAIERGTKRQNIVYIYRKVEKEEVKVVASSSKKRRHITDYNKNLASMLEVERIRDNKTKRERHTHIERQSHTHSLTHLLTHSAKEKDIINELT